MNRPFRDQTFTSSHAWYSRVPGCIFVHKEECKVGVVGCLKEAGALVHHYKTVGVPIPLSPSHLFHILLPYHCHRHHCNHQFWWNQNKLSASHQMCVVTIGSRIAKWGELRIPLHNCCESWQRRRKSMVQLKNSNRQFSKKTNFLQVP